MDQKLSKKLTRSIGFYRKVTVGVEDEKISAKKEAT